MTLLARKVTSFPDNVPMDVKDDAQTLLAASDSNDESVRLALYDTDNLTFSPGSFVSISELREFMGLKQFNLQGSTFELRDSSANILELMKSSASDKSAIIDGAQSLKLTDGSATTFNVDDASLLLGKSVAMPNGYKVADTASKIQGEVTSASDLGVLSAAKGLRLQREGLLPFPLQNIMRSLRHPGHLTQHIKSLTQRLPLKLPWVLGLPYQVRVRLMFRVAL